MKHNLTLTAICAFALAATQGFAQSGSSGSQGTQPTGSQGSQSTTRSQKSSSSASQSSETSATTGSANRLNSGDSTFVRNAMEGGMAEVELGNLAVQKGSSQTVKGFGQRMVDDHTKANNELHQIASNKGITGPATLSSKMQSMKDKLNGLSGAAFDRMYMQQMVSDHQKDVAEFRKEANNGTDPELKAFAAKTLPTLEEHLKLAQSGYQEVKNAK